MVNTDSMDDGTASVRGLADYLGWDRAHADILDARQWVVDLGDMLRVAWNLMTPEQGVAFQSHPDILAHANAEDLQMGTPWAAGRHRPVRLV